MARHSKPTKIKILNGEPNRDRINKNEPDLPSGIPSCPGKLNKFAKQEWKRITREMNGMGILTKVDRAALAGYCQAWGRWMEVESKIKKLTNRLEGENKDPADAYLLKTTSGNVVISPLLKVANICMDQMKSFLVEFGMTPASRTRIQVDKNVIHEDELDEFLNTGKMN